MALLGGTHPAAAMDHQLADDMHNMKITHSRQICGIVAHGKDRLVEWQTFTAGYGVQRRGSFVGKMTNFLWQRSC